MTCNNYTTCTRCRGNCFFLIPAILIALLTFTIGLLVGAAIAATVLENLAAFIVIAVVFFVLLVVFAIAYFCRCARYND